MNELASLSCLERKTTTRHSSTEALVSYNELEQDNLNESLDRLYASASTSSVGHSTPSESELQVIKLQNNQVDEGSPFSPFQKLQSISNNASEKDFAARLRNVEHEEVSFRHFQSQEDSRARVRREVTAHLSALRVDSSPVPKKGPYKPLEPILRNALVGETESRKFYLGLLLNSLYMYVRGEESYVRDSEKALRVVVELVRATKLAPNIIICTGGIPIVIEALSHMTASVTILQQTTEILLHLTCYEKAREQIIENGGAEAVCYAMKEHLATNELQLYGAMFLSNLCFGSDSNKVRIGKFGGLDTLVRAMMLHKSDAELQTRCCLAIRNLACGCRVNQWMAGRALALEAISEALKEFPLDVNLLHQGCAAYSNLCVDEPENRARAAQIGVHRLVLAGLQQTTDVSCHIEHCLASLSYILLDIEDFQTYFSRSNALKTTLDAMKRHVTSKKVLEHGCSILRHLLFERENRLAMQACGGLEVLVRALRESAEDEVVARHVILAIGNAIFDISNSKSAFGRYGGMSAIVDVMYMHIGNERIQEHGCRALRNLSDSDGLSTRLLVECGAVDACIFACSSHPAHAKIQEHSLAMLYNMSFYDKCLQRMTGLDVERMAAGAIEVHGESTLVVAQGNALLERLSSYLARTRAKPAAVVHKTSENGLRAGLQSMSLGSLKSITSMRSSGGHSMRRESRRNKSDILE